MAYQKHDQNSCCFSSLALPLKEPNQFASADEIATRISSLLTGEILYRVMFANTIMTDEKIIKGDQHLRYKLEHWKNWYS